MLQSHVEVGDGLRLYPLGSIDDQQSALTGGDGAGDFVGEVHVPRGIDEVEDVVLTLQLVVHLDCVALDGDPSLTL